MNKKIFIKYIFIFIFLFLQIKIFSLNSIIENTGKSCNKYYTINNISLQGNYLCSKEELNDFLCCRTNHINILQNIIKQEKYKNDKWSEIYCCNKYKKLFSNKKNKNDSCNCAISKIYGSYYFLIDNFFLENCLKSTKIYTYLTKNEYESFNEKNDIFWSQKIIITSDIFSLMTSQKKYCEFHNKKEELACGLPYKYKITQKNKIFLISAAGMNFGYGKNKNILLNILKNKPKLIKKHLYNLWNLIFTACLKNDIYSIVLPSIGLGVFSPKDEYLRNILLKIYFESLCEVIFLFKEKYKFNIFISANKEDIKTFLEKEINKFKLQEIVNPVSCNIFVLARNIGENSFKCALINPSDEEVLSGNADIGMFYKHGINDGYVGEEHIATIFSASINSKRFCKKLWEYENVIYLDDARH
jgi:hypothetical protein